MRHEDKEVDGPDIKQAEQRRRHNELVEEDAEALHDLDGKPALSREDAHTDVVSVALRTILRRELIIINDLGLSQREQRALEALKTAVDGRDQEIDHFVYAEDRRSLLEQALAVLQPDLVALDQVGALDDVRHDIAALREELGMLEDAEEEILDSARPGIAKAEGDRDDKPDADGDGDDPQDGALDGPERPVPPKPATTLGDPDEIAAAAAVPWWRRSDG